MQVVDFVGLHMDSCLVFTFMYWLFKLLLRLGFIHYVVDCSLPIDQHRKSSKTQALINNLHLYNVRIIMVRQEQGTRIIDLHEDLHKQITTRKILKNRNSKEKNEEGDNKFQVVRQVNQPATWARVVYQSQVQLLLSIFGPYKKNQKKIQKN